MDIHEFTPEKLYFMPTDNYPETPLRKLHVYKSTGSQSNNSSSIETFCHLKTLDANWDAFSGKPENILSDGKYHNDFDNAYKFFRIIKGETAMANHNANLTWNKFIDNYVIRILNSGTMVTVYQLFENEHGTNLRHAELVKSIGREEFESINKEFLHKIHWNMFDAFVYKK